MPKRPECPCGCGKAVRYEGAYYARGHMPDEVRLAAVPRKAGGPPLCASCGKPVAQIEGRPLRVRHFPELCPVTPVRGIKGRVMAVKSVTAGVEVVPVKDGTNKRDNGGNKRDIPAIPRRGRPKKWVSETERKRAYRERKHERPPEAL